MNKIKEIIGELKSIVDKDFDLKTLENVEEKSNEVMNTTAVWYGKELIPQITADPLLNMLGNYSALLPMLPGNHGNDMGVSEKVPVVWEASDFEGNTEWTGTPFNYQDPTASWPTTWEITITQGQFILPIAVSKRELKYSIVDLEALIRNRINLSAAKTLDKYILNADDAASWNVNYDGWAAPAKAYYMQGNGWVRDTVIADWNTVDIWTLDKDSFLDMLNKIDARYADDLGNLLRVMPRNVYNKALWITELVTFDKYSNGATIITGKLGNIYGIEVLVTSAMPALALATGKVHSSTGNTLGQFALIYKPAIQYGFGMPVEITTQAVPGKWALMYATFEFGFGLVYDKAWLGKTIVIWRNVTV